MSEFRFFHPIEVRYGDLDPQGHLNNAKYLTYFEAGRIHYFTKLGLFTPGIPLWISASSWPSARHFHAPVEYGTPVKVGVRTSKLGNKSMIVEQNVVQAETGRCWPPGR
jgi:acyl-CoA thioester hydrolase